MLPRVRKTRAILALLALAAPRPISRSQLAALLWSRREPAQARGSLRQALHELQDALAPHASALLRIDRAEAALQPEGLEVLRDPDDAQAVLGNLGGIDPALDEYLLAERRTQAQRARIAAEQRLATAADPAAALTAARALLALDQAHEPAWQAVIRALLDQGNRDAALAAFEECRAALVQAAQLTPAIETIALLQEARPPPESAAASPSSAGGRLLATPSPQRLRVGVAQMRAANGAIAPALAAALTEEIVLALSPFRWLSCVPVTALMPFLDEAAGREAFWQQIGLDCLIDGAVQESGSQLRATVRLLDLRAGGEVVWTGRFDRPTGDLLHVQEDIAAEAVSQIEPRLLMWDGRRAGHAHGPRATARELLGAAVRGLARLDRPEFHAAGQKLQQALRLDPGNAAIHAWLAQWHLFALGQGWAGNVAEAGRQARQLASAAVALAPDDAHALALAGHVRGFLDREPDGALGALDRAIAANPNLPLAWCRSAFAYSYAGQHDEALERAARARRMANGHPLAFLFEGTMAVPLLLRGEYEAAVRTGARAIALNPGFSSSYKTQLAALGHLGRRTEAHEIRARLLALEPGFSVGQAMDRSPIRRPEDRSRYAEGLRLGGLT